MPDALSLKQEFVQDYGEAYQHFGLPVLMGRIVGLLLFEGRPVSLDEITSELGVSKGPVSQIVRRLRDHNLVLRKWVPGDRKDYYEADPNIFGNAFQHRIALMQSNLDLAQKYINLLETTDNSAPQAFRDNVQQMAEFYTLMTTHFKAFADEWQRVRSKK